MVGKRIIKLELDDGQRIISEDVEKSSVRNDVSYPDEYYEVESICTKLNEMFSEKSINVAIQLPPQCVENDSFRICNKYMKLMDESCLIFSLGDSNFGSWCCDDLVGAEHLSADILIHYGHACFSSVLNYSVKVLYAGHLDLDIDRVVKEFESTITEVEVDVPLNVILLYDTVFRHSIYKLEGTLKQKSWVDSLLVGKIPVNSDQETNKKLVGGLLIDLPEEESLSSYTILYISSTCTTATSLCKLHPYLLNILFSCFSGPNAVAYFFAYSPKNCITNMKQVQKHLSKFLSRRYYQIQKVRNAKILGILVNSYQIDNFSKYIHKLTSSITNQNRTCYIFSVGKINIAKLANFAEVDAFIIFGCPENTIRYLHHETNDFHLPIITPYEWSCYVLDQKIWDGSYTLDLVSWANFLQKQVPKSQQDNDEPFYSLINGSFQSTQSCCNHLQDENNTDIIQYQKFNAAQFLKQREYQGLQQNIKQTEIQSAIEGQYGIASGYTNKT